MYEKISWLHRTPLSRGGLLRDGWYRLNFIRVGSCSKLRVGRGLHSFDFCEITARYSINIFVWNYGIESKFRIIMKILSISSSHSPNSSIHIQGDVFKHIRSLGDVLST